jgi:deoxyribodipyrimidine photo-lyase
MLRPVDSPYVAAPGTVTKADGSAFRVFSPDHRAWRPLAAGAEPSPPVTGPRWVTGLPGAAVRDAPDLGTTAILPPGDQAARERLEHSLEDGARAYAERRTSRPPTAPAA